MKRKANAFDDDDHKVTRLAATPEALARMVGRELVQRVPAGAARANPFRLAGRLEELYLQSLAPFRQWLAGPRRRVSSIANGIRNIASGMDELVNTGLVKWMVVEARSHLDARDLGALERGRIEAHLVELFASMSALRMSTGNVGYALGDRRGDQVQHPTSRRSRRAATFAESTANHWLHDTIRQAFVLGSVLDQLRVTSTAHDITGWMMTAGAEYTLNYFAAPLSAPDVARHARVRGRTRDRRRREVHVERESVRSFLLDHAPQVVAPGQQDARNNWRRLETDVPRRALLRATARDEAHEPVDIYRRLHRAVSPQRRFGSPQPSRPASMRRTRSESDLSKFFTR
jgi:hypothetical protein